ncbi:MAG: hypothetical protein J2P48_06610 [Alphaproteobacteria bacterium]|nr:hypothetical protein [Alphaproteobacteria bacterium]
MHILSVALALAFWVGLSQDLSAESPFSLPSPVKPAKGPQHSQLANLVQGAGISRVAKVQTAERTQEGEASTSAEQRCPGLERTGSPGARVPGE